MWHIEPQPKSLPSCARVISLTANGFAKFAITGFISISAAIAYFVLAIVISLAIGG